MYFYFKCVCFSWILSYTCIAADNMPECNAEDYNITHVGHSGFLIKWNTDEIVSSYPLVVTWYPYPGEKNLAPKQYVRHTDGQYKILSLKLNTSYRIEILNQVEDEFEDVPSCWLAGKTLIKTTLPTKPDFEFSIDNSNNLYEYDTSTQLGNLPLIVKIDWFPCGKKGYCEKEELAGSHFSVKYKILEFRWEWRKYEYSNSHTLISGLLPGRIYEIVVTSISSVENVDLETDSDSQEVYIMPKCCPVRNVKIIAQSNSSVLISWKPPEHCQQKDPILHYTIVYGIFNDSSSAFSNYYSNNEYPNMSRPIVLRTKPGFIAEHIKVRNLTIGTRYIFVIIPWYGNNQREYGLEYQIDYTML